MHPCQFLSGTWRYGLGRRLKIRPGQVEGWQAALAHCGLLSGAWCCRRSSGGTSGPRCGRAPAPPACITPVEQSPPGSITILQSSRMRQLIRQNTSDRAQQRLAGCSGSQFYASWPAPFSTRAWCWSISAPGCSHCRGCGPPNRHTPPAWACWQPPRPPSARSRPGQHRISCKWGMRAACISRMPCSGCD